MANPKEPRGRKKRQHPGYNLNVWVDASIGEAFERFMAKTQPKPTKLSAVEHVLRTGLIQLGFAPKSDA